MRRMKEWMRGICKRIEELLKKLGAKCISVLSGFDAAWIKGIAKQTKLLLCLYTYLHPTLLYCFFYREYL